MIYHRFRTIRYRALDEPTVVKSACLRRDDKSPLSCPRTKGNIRTSLYQHCLTGAFFFIYTTTTVGFNKKSFNVTIVNGLQIKQNAQVHRFIYFFSKNCSYTICAKRTWIHIVHERTRKTHKDILRINKKKRRNDVADTRRGPVTTAGPFSSAEEHTWSHRAA